MRVFIENNNYFYNEIKYIFSIFSFNKGIKYTLIDDSGQADLVISTNESSDIRISEEFYLKLNQQKFGHANFFINDTFIRDPKGYIDYLSSAFYILNVIQEIDNSDEDEFGRFKYLNSFQYKFNNIKSNIVQDIFDCLFDSVNKFNAIIPIKRPTRIFLSRSVFVHLVL